MLNLSDNAKTAPYAGRVKITYPSNLAAQSISGVSPAATDAQIEALCDSISQLQTATIDQAFFTAENELAPA